MSQFVSSSKSTSIRDIENKFGFSLSDCTHFQLNRLTSKSSDSRSIRKLSDLMLNNKKQFDIENMTDKERANLKYLVMSTDEVLDVLKRKAKSIYYKPRYARLRFLMSYEDFYQICAHKLLLNDGILKFNANYKLECAIQFWFDRVAGWKCIRKANIADEVTILDKPCSDDTETTLGDLILQEQDDREIDTDTQVRIKTILDHMDDSISKRIILKAGNTVIPFSERNLAKLFIVCKLGKKELSKIMYNVSNDKLVSNQIFNKFYKRMMAHIVEVLHDEYKEFGESFNMNIEEF